MKVIYDKQQLKALPGFQGKYDWQGIPPPITDDFHTDIDETALYQDINRSVWFLNQPPQDINDSTCTTIKQNAKNQLSQVAKPATLAEKHLKILEILWNQYIPYFAYKVLNKLFFSNYDFQNPLSISFYNERAILTFSDGKWSCLSSGMLGFRDDNYTIPSMGCVRFINRAVFDASLLTDLTVLPTDTNQLIKFVQTNLNQPNGFELDYVELEGSPFLIKAFASYLKAPTQAALDTVYEQSNQYTHAESLRIEREKTSNLNRTVSQIYTKEKLDITPKWDMKYKITPIAKFDDNSLSLFTDIPRLQNTFKFCGQKIKCRNDIYGTEDHKKAITPQMLRILTQVLKRDRCCVPNNAAIDKLAQLHIDILELTWSQTGVLSIMSTMLCSQLMSNNCFVLNDFNSMNLYYNHGNWICDVQGSIKVDKKDNMGRNIALPHHYLEYRTFVLLDLSMLKFQLNNSTGFKDGSTYAHFKNKQNLKTYIIEILKQPNGFELYEIQIIRGDFLLRKLVDTYVRSYSAAEITDTSGSLNHKHFVDKKPHIDILISYIKANENRGVDARSAFGFLTGGRHKTAQAKVAAARKLMLLLQNNDVDFNQTDIAALNDGQLKIFLRNMQIIIDPKVFAAICNPARKISVNTTKGNLNPS